MIDRFQHIILAANNVIFRDVFADADICIMLTNLCVKSYSNQNEACNSAHIKYSVGLCHLSGAPHTCAVPQTNVHA